MMRKTLDSTVKIGKKVLNTHKTYNLLIAKIGSNAIIQALEKFLTDARKERIQKVLEQRVQSIQLALEAPSDINNALAAIRTAEAFGISKIHLIEPEGEARHARLITQGAIYWVELMYYPNLTEFLKKISEDRLILAGGIMGANMPLSSVPILDPICLILGNEQRGLSEAALKACQIHYSIPMNGMSESLNLSVSAAISLYDTTTRKRTLLNMKSDLTQKQYIDLKARYYLHSVDGRVVKAIFKIHS